jgi:hypothetical protein
MKTPKEICAELVRLYEAGLRPQRIAGMHREEQDFDDLVKAAKIAVSQD